MAHRFALNIGTSSLVIGEIENCSDARDVLINAIVDAHGVTTVTERGNPVYVRNSAIRAVTSV